MTFDSIESAITDLSTGKMIVVVDDESRENEGDLVMIAEKATPEAINFMIQKGRGLVCVPLSSQILEKLDLAEMVINNSEHMKTAFTVSVDADPKFGVTTGISAADRSKTIQVLVADSTLPHDLRRPGHIFPLRGKPGGVLERAGHTEAAIDLAELAGFKKAGVICEIIKDDGTMARLDDLKDFAKTHSLKIISIADLIAYRIQNSRFVKRMAQAKLPTEFGEFELVSYEDSINKEVHVALVFGEVSGKSNVLVRVHSECLTGDVFGSRRCDCGVQLHQAMKQIAESKCGVLLYMRQEGRGIGLTNKIRAYALQDQGHDTVEANRLLGFEADLRTYGVGAQILTDLGLSTLHLLTNNPRKVVGIEGYNLKVTQRVPIVIPPNPHNQNYLSTKASKLGHIL
jgi:3,4-dihydroxy 2-butanone 4-phosphate synthase/GTP cyclohydrolase II